MGKLRNKKIIGLSVFASALIAAFAVYYYKNFYNRNKPEVRVEKSLPEILEERLAHAQKNIESPLGQSMLQKNWAEFDRIYHPETDSLVFAEVIRSAFIKNQFLNFSQEDYDQVFARIIKTIQAADQKHYSKLGLLASQTQRIPTPSKNTESYKTLTDWLKTNDRHPFLKKIALLKLVASDSEPAPEAVKLYLHGLSNGNTQGMSMVEWIRMMDEIRNIEVRKTCIQTLSKLYPKLDAQLRPYALVTLAHEPNIESAALTRYALHALKQNESADVEAGLKSIPPLIYAKLLDQKQKDLILQRLNNFPESLNTPFIRTKIQEIKLLLASKP